MGQLARILIAVKAQLLEDTVPCAADKTEGVDRVVHAHHY